MEEEWTAREERAMEQRIKKDMGEDILRLHRRIIARYKKIWCLKAQQIVFKENNQREIKKLEMEIFNLKREIRRRLKEKYNLVKKWKK